MINMIERIEKTQRKGLKIKDPETRAYIQTALAGLKILHGRKYTAEITIHIINQRIKRDIKKIIKEEKNPVHRTEYLNEAEKIVYCTNN